MRFLQTLDKAKDLNPESKALREAITGLRGGALDLNDRLTRTFFNVRQSPLISSFGA